MRMNVMKDEQFVVFIDFLTGNGACGNFAEKAVVGMAHAVSTARPALIRIMPLTMR